MLTCRFLIAIVAVAFIASSNATPVSPYAGQERREIKSLSQQEMDDYLAGKGMGFAKAAELNGYPGPSHVMELADRLNLTPEQRQRTEALFNVMKSSAIDAGQALIGEERALNELFVSKAVTQASLKKAVERIAAHQAQLRLIHLETHLAQLSLLSPHQVKTYNEIRGYSTAAPQTHQHGHR